MLKKFIPSSLFIRFVLIIILPTIFAQLIATYIFYNRHWHSVSKNMSYSLANDIKIILDLEEHNYIYKKDIYEKLNIYVKERERNDNDKVIEFYPTESHFLYKKLKESVQVPIQITFIDDRNTIKVEVFQNKKIFTFQTNSKRVENSTTYIFILWMTGTSIIFLFMSIIFTRNQIRPIIKLARAAEKFGKGQAVMHLKPEGAQEIRKACIAFLKMKERIEKQISYRTEMLAGVSHDLRTPLTRMKLQLALSKDTNLEPMLEDIKDMERMINSYLDFVRGEEGREYTKSISLRKFLEKAVLPYVKQNLNCYLDNIPNIKIPIKINAINRCLQNLLDNSFRYADKVLIKAEVSYSEFIIELHDNGPGIPQDKYLEVFRPFFRLENSRNKETGGVGLGLAITKDIIMNYGGNIELNKSDALKGLKVIITLPL
jgi:two-component system, OmpR family, osmolarity sensor histidine kinase EnvZ